MSEHENGNNDTADVLAPPTQAQLYDDLRRIGQLEDQKQAIQNEIEERTLRLRNALPDLDSDSLLYRMLAAALQPNAVAQPRSPTTRSGKKTPRKKKH